MPFKLRVPPTVVDLIRSVRPPIGDDVVAELERLAERPRLGTPIRGGLHDGLMCYEFRIRRLPISQVFAVLYQYSQDEEYLDILDFGCLDGAPPRLRPPRFGRPAG